MPTISPKWTPERFKFFEGLCEGFREPYSWLAIRMSQRFGDLYTKNMCLAKARRAGFEKEAYVVSNDELRKRFAKARAARKPKRISEVKKAPPLVPVVTAEPLEFRCDIMGLTNSTCRWPVTDGSPFMFCGAPDANLEERRVYCSFHTRMAH